MKGKAKRITTKVPSSILELDMAKFLLYEFDDER